MSDGKSQRLTPESRAALALGILAAIEAVLDKVGDCDPDSRLREAYAALECAGNLINPNVRVRLSLDRL